MKTNVELLSHIFSDQSEADEYKKFLQRLQKIDSQYVISNGDVYRKLMVESIAHLSSIFGRLGFIPEVFSQVPIQDPITNGVLKSMHVFIVHGHDVAAKESTARFIEKIGLNPIVLHEQPNAGRTIVEKFENYSNVGFAVALLTPDDIGSVKGNAKDLKYRARQNVILELGYFMGKLGRGRVCALYKEGVEIPSDYQGVLYIPMDSAGAWKMQLAKEIKNAGIEVDLNKL